VNAQGGRSGRGINSPLHVHPLLGHTGSLPVAERAGERVLGVPYFKHDCPEAIERYADIWRGVALSAAKAGA
jgi:hypothetical protein